MHVSYEVFPPKTVEGKHKLLDTLRVLSEYPMEFVSVTCGAGGSSNSNNFSLCREIVETLKLPCLPHITCIGQSQQELLERIKEYDSLAINAYLALRGDLPSDEAQQLTSDFQYAKDLCEFISQRRPENKIYVAGYPEGHQQAACQTQDFEYQLQKAQHYNCSIITQLFFENDIFLRYVEKLQQHGYDLPVYAGIFPITSAAQIKKILSLSSATIPSKLASKLNEYANDDASMQQFGIDFATEQITQLHAQGHRNFHLYTMNKSEHINKIRQNIH